MKSKCSTCVFLNGEDGYCRKKQKHVNILENEDCRNYTEPAENKTKTRICQNCGQELPVTDFRRRNYGYDHICKACAAAKAANERNERLEKLIFGKADNANKLADNANVDLAKVADADLVVALRSRGWEVTCKRTVVEEL